MPIYDASARSTEYPLTVLRILKETMGEWLLIGAFARDIVVNAVAGLPRGSETLDVDIAIAAIDDDQFRARVAKLGKAGGSRIRFRAEGFAVDVIAYGGIAPDNLLEDEGTTLDVTGLAEAQACALRVALAEDLQIDCASLHAQVLLKLVAWQARQIATPKDANDLVLLLEAGHHGIYADQLWEDEAALAACEYVPDLAGAYRLGHLISRDFDSTSVDHILPMLEGEWLERLADAATSWIHQRETVVERLAALRRGLASS